MALMAPRTAIAAILMANAISLVGNVFAAIAIPWFVLLETGSALQTGIAALFASAPLAIGALFGGVLTDRVGSKWASIGGDVLSGLSVAAIPLLHALGILEFWHLLLFAFAGSLCDAPAAAAREAMLPDLTRRAKLQTEQVTSALTGTEHGAYLLAAPIAGVGIAVLGAPALLWIDGATFALSAGIVALAGSAGTARAGRGRNPYLRELLDGVRFIRANPGLLIVTLAATAGAFFIDPLSPVLLPVFVRQEFGDPAALGLAVGGYGIGGLVGIAVFSRFSPALNRAALYRVLWIAYAAASFGLLLVGDLLGLLVVVVVIGMTVGAIDPLERAVRQEQTPPDLRGRVFAATYAIPKLVVPAGVLVAGALIEAFGLRSALLVFAVGNTIIALTLVLHPKVRRLE
jgi:MFS family permease